MGWRNVFRLAISRDTEGTCLGILARDVKDLAALEALASHYWSLQRFSDAIIYSARALAVDERNREMLLINAASNYHLGNVKEARETAARALGLNPEEDPAAAALDSGIARLLSRIPGLRSRTVALQRDVRGSASEQARLLSWAKEIVKSQPAASLPNQ